MPLLNLAHWGTKQAMNHETLRGLPRLGRGMFCVVFDKGDTVLKLTADSVQYAYYTDGCRPQGQLFPRLVKDYGVVGAQHEHDLYLVEMEKLTPFGKRADCPDRAWEQRRAMLKIASELHGEFCSRFWNISNPVEFSRRTSEAILYEMSDSKDLCPSLRDACYDLYVFMLNTGGCADFSRSNFMLRGKTMVFNDVMADIESICAHKSRRRCH